MADVQEAIRRLTIEATNRGVAETTALLKRMVDQQNEVAVSSEKSERATQTMEKRLESIQRRYDDEYRKRRELTKIEKDLDAARAQGLVSSQRQSELIALAAAKMGAGSSANTLYAKSLATVKGEAEGLASRLGPVGGLVAGLGPAGLTAAAAVGGLALALYQADQAAQAFARDMLQLRDVSQTIGLSTIQFQAIADEGSKFALSEERVGQVLQRFTAQMEEFRRGQGELFSLVQRIDPALAREMATARDTATAIDYLAKVYEKAGDARAKLDRAIAGRSGGTAGLLFQSIGQSGGVDSITAEFEKTGDAIDKNMIEKIARLKAEIDDMAADASRNFASIFSAQLLEAQYTFYSVWRDISREAKSFSLSGDWDKFIDGLSMASRRMAGLGVSMGLFKERGFGHPAADESGMIDYLNSLNVPLPTSRPTQQIDRSALEFEINLEKARISALGTAATATERLAQRKRELDLAVRDNVISQQDYNRALGQAGLETVMQLEGRRLALLGEQAKVDDIVAQKKRELNLAVQQGVDLSEREIAQILQKTRLQAEYSRLEGPRGQLQFERDQLGRNDIDATVASRLRGQGLPIDLDSTVAAEMRLNEELKLSKSLVMDFGSGLARDMDNGVKGIDALGNAFNRLKGKLLDIALDKALSGLFGGKTGGFNIFSLFNFGGGAGVAADPISIHHTGYGPGDSITTRYVHPAYFDDAPRFHTGIGPGERAAIIKDDESVLTAGQMRALAPISAMRNGDIQFNLKITNLAGADVSAGQPQVNANGGIDLDIMISKSVAKSISTPGNPAAQALKNVHGVTPMTVRRG